MTSPLDLAAYTATSGLQIFAIFVNFFFPALALGVVGTRAAGRLATSQFGWDDWLVCIAMLLSAAQTILSFFFIKTNFIGIHTADIPPHDLTDGLIWAYAVQILYNPILALVKSSVLIFLLRLFGQKNGVRRFIIGLNIANILQMIGIFLAVTLQCLPIAFNWDPTIKGGHCVNRGILYTCTSAVNIITDLLVLGLPLWIFVDLKIPRRTKLALLFVFLLGFLVTITSIVRLVILVQGEFGLVVSKDPTFNIGFVTSGIETNLALITASAPALRPIFRAKLEKSGGWLSRFSLAPSKGGDLETGSTKRGNEGSSVDWDSRQDPLPTVGSGFGGKFGRGGSRGGRRGGRSGVRGGKKKSRPSIRVRTDVAELRSQSPRASEEQAMTFDGIVRVSDIQREIDGIVNEIGIAGAGTYTGVGFASSTGARAGATATSPRKAMQQQKQQQQQQQQARPSTAGSAGAGRNRKYTERYYSASVYPDLDFTDRDYNEERFSKYGDKRFALYTPRGSAFSRSNSMRGGAGSSWRDTTEGGQPF